MDGMTRRGFLAAATTAAAGSAVVTANATNDNTATISAVAGGRPLKVCVFADIHYFPGVFPNSENTSFLERILARAEAEHCDMMIHLGDFVHTVRAPKQKEYIKLYNDFSIPGYHILGNHDQDGNPWEETCAAYRMPGGYYSFDKGGFRFVIMDPNYFCNEPGVFIHSSHGNYFKRPKGSTLNWIPPDQMEWIRATIVGSPLPCVVLSHQSLERSPAGARINNADDVIAIFREANAKKPGTVRLVVNGHMHMDNMRILENIAYWDVNSANYQFYPRRHDKYPEEYVKAHRSAPNTIAWKDPLSAILTLWPDGRIKIDGSSSDWLFGVSPADARMAQYLVDGRRVTCAIQSTDLTINYA